MKNRIKRHEGYKPVVYDDATGSPIIPGDTLKGHPTIGYGRAVDVTPLTQDEADFLLENDVVRSWNTAMTLVRNWIRLTPARQEVLTEMVFQMGGDGVKTFQRFLRAVEWEDHEIAADEMLDSRWAKEQSPARARELSAMWRQG